MDTDGTETARYRHSPPTPAPVSLFDADPATYDRARPRYPPQLYSDLFEWLAVPSPDILEVGAGTGKATRDLLRYASTLTAVELGPRLSDFLRTKFAGEQRLTVINAPFESAPLTPASYDLVVAATAFHWLDARTRLDRVRNLLRPPGCLAVIDTNQVRSEVDRGYFARSTPIYRRYFPGETEGEVPGEDVEPAIVSEVTARPNLFDHPALFRYRWDQHYTHRPVPRPCAFVLEHRNPRAGYARRVPRRPGRVY